METNSRPIVNLDKIRDSFADYFRKKHSGAFPPAAFLHAELLFNAVDSHDKVYVFLIIEFEGEDHRDYYGLYGPRNKTYKVVPMLSQVKFKAVKKDKYTHYDVHPDSDMLHNHLSREWMRVNVGPSVGFEKKALELVEGILAGKPVKN